jgi:8-oxo-dGTP diphosphatase
MERTRARETNEPATCIQSVALFTVKINQCFEIRPFLPILAVMREVSVGIIQRNGQVLACQRKGTTRYPLKWEFPGGKIESGETPEDAVVRELHEELAITATLDRELHRQEWTYPRGTDPHAVDGRYRVYYFLVRDYTGDIVNHTFEQIKWVTPAELLHMDILEGNREAIELLVNDAKADSPLR